MSCPADVGERTLLAPAGHAAVDEARVPREADVGAEPEPLHHARPEALDQHVGLLDQPEHGLDAVRLLQVDADAPPAAIQEVERRRLRIAAARRSGRGRRG